MRKKIRKSQPGYTNIVGYRIIRMKKCQFSCSPHIFRLHYSQKLTFANSLICVSYPHFSAFTTIFYKFFALSKIFPAFYSKAGSVSRHTLRVSHGSLGILPRLRHTKIVCFCRPTIAILPSKAHKLAPLASANFRPHHGRIGVLYFLSIAFPDSRFPRSSMFSFFDILFISPA